jgi:sulfur carrier protein ThiS
LKLYLQIIGLPELRKIIGSDLEIDAKGNTISDLIDQLCQNFGKQVKDVFFPNGRDLNVNIQVLVNNKLVLPREELKQKIIEAEDQVAFMRYIGGG